MPNKTKIEPIEVTNENFGDLLIESLREHVAIKEGRAKASAIRTYPITAREVAVSEPPVPSADEIRDLRESLRLSQSVFSKALNVSPATSRAWEQRRRVPDGASLRLLQIVRENPRVIYNYVAAAVQHVAVAGQNGVDVNRNGRRARKVKRGK